MEKFSKQTKSFKSKIIDFIKSISFKTVAIRSTPQKLHQKMTEDFEKMSDQKNDRESVDKCQKIFTISRSIYQNVFEKLSVFLRLNF